MDTRTIIQNLEALVNQGKESALLRFSLGNEYLKQGETWVAIFQLRRALELDPNYSAAWKLLGRAFAESGNRKEASDVYRRGIDVAKKRGDQQAAKEMEVLARRLEKEASR
jgi:Tfp pilus assembly protein PilF